MVEKSRFDRGAEISLKASRLDSELRRILNNDEKAVSRAKSFRTGNEITGLLDMNATAITNHAETLVQRMHTENQQYTPQSERTNAPPSYQETAIRQAQEFTGLRKSERLSADAAHKTLGTTRQDFGLRRPSRERTVFQKRSELESGSVSNPKEFFMNIIAAQNEENADFIYDRYVPPGIKNMIDVIGRSPVGAERLRDLAERYARLYQEALDVHEAEQEFARLLPQIKANAERLKAQRSDTTKENEQTMATEEFAMDIDPTENDLAPETEAQKQARRQVELEAARIPGEDGVITADFSDGLRKALNPDDQIADIRRANAEAQQRERNAARRERRVEEQEKRKQQANTIGVINPPRQQWRPTNQNES